MKKFLKSLIFIFIIIKSNNLIILAEIETHNSTQQLFENKYKAWEKWIGNNLFSSHLTGNQPYYEITKMKPAIIPYLINKMKKQSEGFHLSYAFECISKKKFENEEWPDNTLGASNILSKMYIKWWDTDCKKTKEIFKIFYDKLKTFKTPKNKEQYKYYEKIKNLGIITLPLIMIELQKGDKKFIPILSYLTNDEIKKTFTIKECVTYWKTNKEKWTIPFEKINYNMKD